MHKLRAALEKLDEALDQLEEVAEYRPAAPLPVTIGTIKPRTYSDFARTELVRRLDETIQDVQKLMGEAA